MISMRWKSSGTAPLVHFRLQPRTTDAGLYVLDRVCRPGYVYHIVDARNQCPCHSCSHLRSFFNCGLQVSGSSVACSSPGSDSQLHKNRSEVRHIRHTSRALTAAMSLSSCRIPCKHQISAGSRFTSLHAGTIGSGCCDLSQLTMQYSLSFGPSTIPLMSPPGCQRTCGKLQSPQACMQSAA